MKNHVVKLRVLVAGRVVGQLYGSAAGEIFFQYDNEWLAEGFDLAPSTMPFAATPLKSARDPFNGLHGVFSDSLPDGWGLLLMDRAMRARFGWGVGEISPLDRLAYMGNRAMGALEYQPEIQGVSEDHALDIAELAAASLAVLAGSAKEVIADLYLQGGSPGGARPKVAVTRNAATGECRSGFVSLPSGFEHWLVKFHGRGESRDSGRIEMAYAQMAREAGLRIPETELIEVCVPVPRRRKADEAFFAVRRFDREIDMKRHVISASGYLHADHRVPSLDYQHILAATQRLTRDVMEVKRAFRLMVFNVLAHNKDDHGRNFAFIHAPTGWALSPAFDLTWSMGMGDQHTSSIDGRGNPDAQDMIRVARSFNIENPVAVIEEVRQAISRWPSMADLWGVSRGSMKAIQSSLTAIDKRMKTSLSGAAAP